MWRRRRERDGWQLAAHCQKVRLVRVAAPRALLSARAASSSSVACTLGSKDSGRGRRARRLVVTVQQLPPCIAFEVKRVGAHSCAMCVRSSRADDDIFGRRGAGRWLSKFLCVHGLCSGRRTHRHYKAGRGYMERVCVWRVRFGRWGLACASFAPVFPPAVAR